MMVKGTIDDLALADRVSDFKPYIPEQVPKLNHDKLKWEKVMAPRLGISMFDFDMNNWQIAI